MSPADHISPASTPIFEPQRTVRLARWAAAIATASLCATGLVVAASPAGATPASPAGATPASPAKPVTPVKIAKRNPVASTPRFTPVPGGLKVTGWALDPDAPLTNLRVAVVQDGRKTLVAAPTSLRNSAVTTKYRSGATPGYSLVAPVAAGKHIVCVVLDNLGGGSRRVKRCVATPLGRVLTQAQLAKRSPRGAIQTASTTPTSIRLVGWASDPDLVSRRSQVVVYLNGSVAVRRTTKKYVSTRPAGAGGSSRFDVSIPVASATQLACVWVVNVGLGRNTSFGCRALDPRTPASTVANPVAPPIPALNAKVVALATKQIGKPYVWGAVGPKSFDCSGLVTWAYGKYRYTTPRVSQDQIKSARLIPAVRAVPGDLVFYHDGVGDVYHVGIYLRPGLSVAAIDTDQGVDYQRIWDTTATYGSFTHT